MRIIHHVSLNVGPQHLRGFRHAGFDLTPHITPSQSTGGLIPDSATFNISEDDPRWTGVQILVNKFRALDMVHTEFSDAELAQAPYVWIAAWHHGYPEPSGDNGYLQATFDLTDYCESCGIGKRQIAPFRMKAEPKWGTRSAMQLIWIFDEVFVRPTAWEATFRQFGIDRRPVLHHRTQRELESVVQLDIAALAELRMEDNLPYVVCRRCDRRKHAHVTRGFVPAPVPTDAPALKSCQYFGDGCAANRAVLISNAAYRAITAAKLRGMEFDACAG